MLIIAERLKIIVICTIVLFVFVACDSLALDLNILWSKQDLLHTGEIVNSTGGMQLQHEVTLNLKPNYYFGQMPLTYRTITKNLGGGMSMGLSAMPLAFTFDGWQNIFIYKDRRSLLLGMPDGAVAVDTKTNKIIAECKITRNIISDNQLTGFEAIENHYSKKGDAIFTSTFTISSSEGFKINERDSKGSKKQEYFFIWPAGLCSPH